MKNILLAAAIISIPLDVSAGPATPESSLRNGAQIVANARHYQQEYCKTPRNNTTKQCLADFENFVEIEIEHTARHVLYLIAKNKGLDAKDIARLKGDSERMYTIIKELSRNLDRLYMPLPQPSTPTGQAPEKPKAAAIDTR